MKNIADIRQEYTKSGLRESELPCDPLSLFSRWLQEAIDANVEEPTAIIVGTVSPEGRPSTRTVLLKGLHDGKLSSIPTTKAAKEGNWHKIRTFHFPLSGMNLKGKYTSKVLPRKFLRRNRTNISGSALIKAASVHVFLHKASLSQAGCN